MTIFHTGPLSAGEGTARTSLGGLVVLVALALPWIALALPWDPDETRYLEVPREMLASGDWLVPRMNGVPYLEKPPLYYWALALAYQVLGVTPFAARLVSLAAAMGTVIATASLARRVGGAALARRASMVLAASPFFIVLGSIITIDMFFTLWVSAAMALFVSALSGDASAGRGRTVRLHLAYVALALACLTKGLVAFVPPVLVWVAWRRPRSLRALFPPAIITGSLLTLAIAAPWFLAVSVRYPEFPRFFFMENHLGRFFGNEAARMNIHESPLWEQLGVLLGGAFPWSLFLFVPWRRLRSEWKGRPEDRFPWTWLLLGLLFFSVSAGKLPTYVLPLFPALAILAARRIEELAAGGGGQGAVRLWAFLLALIPLSGVLAIVVVRLTPSGAEKLAVFDPWVAAVVGAGLAALGIFASRALARGRIRAAFLGLLALVAISSLGGAVLKTGMDRWKSMDPLARTLASVIRPDDVVVCVGKYFPLFSFRLEREMTCVEVAGELRFGRVELGERPELFLDRTALWDLIRGPKRVFLTIRDIRWKDLEAKPGTELTALGLRDDYLLLSNRKEPWPLARP